MLAANLLTEYAGDRIDCLASLLLDADVKQFDIIFPTLAWRGKEASALLLSELGRTAGGLSQLSSEIGTERSSRPRPLPLSRERARGVVFEPRTTSSAASESTARRTIEAAHGMLTDRAAFCQTLPLGNFVSLCEELKAIGYRPTWFHPFLLEGMPRIAAVWRRQSNPWMLLGPASAAEIEREDKRLRGRGLEPAFISAVIPGTGTGPAGGKYFAVWIGCDPAGTSSSPEASGSRFVVGRSWSPIPTTWNVKVFPFEPPPTPAPPQDWLGVLNSAPLCERMFPFVDFSWPGAPPDPVIPADYFVLVITTEIDLEAGDYWLEVDSDDGVRAYFNGENIFDHWSCHPVATDCVRITATKGKHSLGVDYFEAVENAVLRAELFSESLVLSHESPGRTAHPLFGILEPGVHYHVLAEETPERNLEICRPLLNDGYLPHSMFVRVLPLESHPRISLVWDIHPASDADAVCRANAAVALTRLGHAEHAWPLLRHSVDPATRSHLIHRFTQLGVDPRLLLRRLDQETDVAIRRALILSLGEYGNDGLRPPERERFFAQLAAMYETDNDPGIHSAAGWTLRQCNQGERLEQIDKKLATGNVEGDRRWYVNRQGQTMAVIAPRPFIMGTCENAREREPDEQYRLRALDYLFAISTTEVTKAAFARFRKDWRADTNQSSPSGGPAFGITWYEAAEYCNWLNRQEGIAEEEWCYQPNAAGEYAEGMTLPADWQQRTGYRLPTEGEWEYACRAGAVTQHHFGQGDLLLERYAIYLGNSSERMWPVARLKPNDYGLFDMHGNVAEWSHDRYGSILGENHQKLTPTQLKMMLFRNLPTYGSTVLNSDVYVQRGRAYCDLAGNMRCADRGGAQPFGRYGHLGFRIARRCDASCCGP
jgi:formylglycine-generating enzyme required for sulfatase activity